MYAMYLLHDFPIRLDGSLSIIKAITVVTSDDVCRVLFDMIFHFRYKMCRVDLH